MMKKVIRYNRENKKMEKCLHFLFGYSSFVFVVFAFLAFALTTFSTCFANSKPFVKSFSLCDLK